MVSHIHNVPSNASTPTAKCGSEWTPTDVQQCNVKIVDVDIPTFFPGLTLSTLPQPDLSPALFHTKCTTLPQSPNPHPPHAHEVLSTADQLFFTLLHMAMVPGPEQSTAILDFTAYLLHVLGYTQPQPHKPTDEDSDEQQRIVVRREHDLPLFMCGRTVHAIADLCLLRTSTDPHHTPTVLLLAKAVPTPPSPAISSASIASVDSFSSSSGSSTPHPDPEPPLIAQAIATFQAHNRSRRLMRLPPVEKQVVPAVLMRGSAPVLYRIEVSAGMVECVQTGRVPERVSSVMRMKVPLPQDKEEGIMPLENRKIAFGCLEAFKAFL
ncbi:hypothetical protein Hypma_003072 [Hypsizygus marmoreus]|uniref:Uncharacterized protein n=1 Tax=Hypsizygus marmoreus TaxID=39966 RepID=A0A369J7D8_HYPMA|nr:hypothetical protein Hypma_003072 [Hypsizygus marmoreus]